MQKKFASLVEKLETTGGILFHQGKLIRGGLKDNTFNCTNTIVCNNNNTGSCDNQGDCRKTNNTTQGCHNSGTCVLG